MATTSEYILRSRLHELLVPHVSAIEVMWWCVFFGTLFVVLFQLYRESRQ